MRDAIVAARAPGKLFVTGEYAVLHGAPALVAAVDRHVDLTLRLVEGPGPLSIESVAEGQRHVIRTPTRAEPAGGDAGAVVAAFRVSSGRARRLAGMWGEVVVDSRPFLHAGRKLGLGRSAATVSSAVAAFLVAGGHRSRVELSEAAVAAHELFQGGRGSGADVAATVHGGLVEVTCHGRRLKVAARTFPLDLHLVVGWTGESLPTAALLERFAAATAEREPRALRELCAVATRAADAVARGDVDALLESVAASGALLERLGGDLGIPIVTPALARLVAAARRVGAVAKPSGAGGGDCGIALAASSAQAEAVRAAWQVEGILPLPVAVAAKGVRCEVRAAAAEEVELG